MKDMAQTDRQRKDACVFFENIFQCQAVIDDHIRGSKKGLRDMITSRTAIEMNIVRAFRELDTPRTDKLFIFIAVLEHRRCPLRELLQTLEEQYSSQRKYPLYSKELGDVGEKEHPRLSGEGGCFSE